jgi:hypothetical protein
MPYLILVIGLLLGVYGLYRFFLNADVRQIKALFLSFVTAAVGITLLVMALTGRLVPALTIFVVLLPFIGNYLKHRKAQKEGGSASASGAMTEKEALEVLGLQPGATTDDIQAAYKKLMQKVHPDSQGTDWIAAKLNQARDILLPK